MQETIRVHVVKYRDRENLVMRYRCPSSGKHVSRSTRTAKPREAARTAAKWEAELQEGRYKPTSRMGWDDFVIYLGQHYMAGMRPRSADTCMATFNVFKSLCSPQTVADITTPRVTHFRTKLRDSGRAPATIKRHLNTLAAAMRWAQSQGLIATLPLSLIHI